VTAPTCHLSRVKWQAFRDDARVNGRDTENVKNNTLAKENVSEPAIPRLAYSMKEAAVALGVSYISIHRLLKRGLLKSSSALRTKVIPATELERFLKATTE